MKFKLKMDKAQFVLEREFSLGRGPALDFKVENYEVSGNIEELIKGLQSLAKLIEPQLDNSDKAERDAEFEHAQAKYKEDVDEVMTEARIRMAASTD